jgi:lysophospholipase L1-like esterase
MLRWRSRAALALVATLALLLGGMATPGAARAQGAGIYVALGDSYTSGPLIPNQHGDPIDCGRSDHNYPSLVAQALAVATFVDVSCGSATTKHMTEPQTDLPLGGTNPPQFNALRPDATLVTVGIGGNDAGLVGVAEECAQLGATQPTGTACRDHFAPGGRDTVAAKIEATKPKIAGVLQGIHRRSPGARVAIVGYPDPLPKNGGSCYPMVPLSPDDIRYIDELLVRINAMIAGQAAANDAEFIDTYADSGGHDVCTLPPTRWFEGLVPTEPAYPLHPNAKGEASMARSAIKVLSRPRRGVAARAPVLSMLRVSPRNVQVGRAATVSYRLDRAAAVTLALRRALPGRMSGRRCATPSRSNRRGRRCNRYSRVRARVTVAGQAGTNRYRLSARRLGRWTGRYRLTARPTADGLPGAAATDHFRLAPRRR